MKTLSVLVLFLTSFLAAQEVRDPVVLVPWHPTPREVPLFFSATAAVRLKPTLAGLTSEQNLVFKILQGRPETLSLGLSGEGEVTAVTGEGLRDWSVRVAADGSRFLDLRPLLPEARDAKGPEQLSVQIHTKLALPEPSGGDVTVLLPTPGAATALALEVTLPPDPLLDVQLLKAEGLAPLANGAEKKLVATGAAAMALRISPAGTAAKGLEMLDLKLDGRLAPDGNSVTFLLGGTARSVASGASIELCHGAALVSGVSGEGWHVVLRPETQGGGYELVADQQGELTVSIEIEVPVTRRGDWRAIDFRVPGGVVVPLDLTGLPAGVKFDRSLPVVPENAGADRPWRGFLPATGTASLAWRAADAVADGALFFSSSETTDVRVGSGLLRQSTQLDLLVLQGKLGSLKLALNGPGEVISVAGEAVLGWTILAPAADGTRGLEIKLNRAIDGICKLTIESQAALGTFPVKGQAVRMVPEGSLRHSGWIRVANAGAVRVEVTDASGLIQLAPAQFPGGIDESLRQVFVYRFPAADYAYAIQADQVTPEVGVSEVTIYELAETDRRVTAELELDIREAPLREWEVEIPADHAVASVTGPTVADFLVAGEAKNGMKKLKILFREEVAGRQLIAIRLEKNEAAKAGPWQLPPLGFPGAKSRRGYIGAVAAAGFRLVVGKTSGVAELPLTFFPKKPAGLQQAFRLREDTWQVALTAEALGQSILADVFHLYSLKSGAASASVLINYFVVGAPASEWRVAVPKDIGNLDVTGQNVGRDWRQEGDAVIIPLSRPVLGAGTVLVTFEQPMPTTGGELSPGEVKPLNVQGERGHIHVVSPLQVNHTVTATDGSLLSVDPSELPAEFRVLSSAPTLAAWQYTGRDFKIGMQVNWYDPGETAGQVVDFLKLSSRVSRDGEWATDARMFVKSRGGNTLRLTLPEKTALWEVKVNGSAVNARQDGGATLVPLPERSDDKPAAEVSLRYGARSPHASKVRLGAPRLSVPVVIGEWDVTGDDGRLLDARGGTADLVRSGLAPSGYQWLSKHRMEAALAVMLSILAVSLGWAGGQVRRTFALLCGLGLLVLALAQAGFSLRSAASRPVLEYAAPVVAQGAEVVVEVANLAPWRALTGWGVAVGVLVGGLILVQRRKDRWGAACGLAMITAGVLDINGGAVLFFLLLACAALFVCIRQGKMIFARKARPVAAPAAAAVIALLAVMPPQRAAAAEPVGMKPAESMVHDWRIQDGRLRGTVEVTVRGEVGSRFLLLKPPAVLGGFEGPGLRVVKIQMEGGPSYVLVAEQAGVLTGKARFEMPLADPLAGWQMPGGAAALRQVSVRWNQPGWEFVSPEAARIRPLDGLAAGESGAFMALSPAPVVNVQARARQRDVGSEETRFFAEVANLCVPGPGVVNGRHLVAIRPAQGQLNALSLKVPAGFTVSEVKDGPVSTWRFDPVTRALRVTLDPAQSAPFNLTIETQQGAGALPANLELEPLRVDGTAGEIGYLALAFGDEAQAESVEVSGLTRVNAGDFRSDLLPRNTEGQPLATLQHAFRYGPDPALAKVRVTAVSPEIRSEFWQLVSLGEDRLLLSSEIAVTITRAGVFRLQVELPEALEIESATGEGLSHWSEGKVTGKRVLTLHLTGKTVGTCAFHVVLSGPAPGARENWPVPRLNVTGASRETGLLTVVPERGLQVRAVSRKHVSQVDPRELVGQAKGSAKAAERPGALAYRVLQGDWALDLAIGKLDPWVTAKVLHEATLREGQLLNRVVIDYQIENASVKSQRIRIPGLDAAAAATLRASGPAVADLVPVDGDEPLWEVRFERGVAGDSRVELQYQRRCLDEGNETIGTIGLEQARLEACFVAIRTAGRLEVEPGMLPRGWQRTDWTVAQATLGEAAAGPQPLLAFKVAEPEGPLPVVLKRLKLSDQQRLRVASGALTTLLAANGHSLTAVDLRMEVVGKGTLRLSLPDGAELFNVLVNEEAVTLVREGGGWLFHVFPAPTVGEPASVRFVYSAAAGKALRLEGPVLNVPMENLEWRVLVPEGWQLASHKGDFELRQETVKGSFRMEDYQSFALSRKQSESARASAILAQANDYLQQGQQELAGQALRNVLRSNKLDEATNEDARVLEYKTKTQQAVLGLNTRRQRVQLDNRRNLPTADNAQLDRAAAANPLMQGQNVFDPRQFDRLLEGNSADENAALKEIATRIVAQQLAAEPAPRALDLTLPERGTVLTFGRSVQVDGKHRMALDLKLRKDRKQGTILPLLACLAVGALVFFRSMAKRPLATPPTAA